MVLEFFDTIYGEQAKAEKDRAKKQERESKQRGGGKVAGRRGRR